MANFNGDSEVKSKSDKKSKMKPRRSGRHFKISWQKDKRFSSWVIKSPNDLPFCKFCAVELKASGGAQDLVYHMKTKKHIRNIELYPVNKTADPPNFANFKIESDSWDSYDEMDSKDLDANQKNTNSTLSVEISRNMCKLCGDTLHSNPICNQMNILKKYVDIEKEKENIETEMKEFISQLRDNERNIDISPLQAFSNMLIADMNKLPEAVQRKLRMSIMLQVDAELSKSDANSCDPLGSRK